MTLSLPSKKTAAALALVIPLTLAACSDEGSGETETTTSSATSEETTSEDTSAEETTSEEESEDPDAEDADDAEEDAGEEPDTAAMAQGEPNAAANPQDPAGAEDMEFEDADPVDGEPAGEQDIQEINGLLNGMYEVNTFQEMVSYLPDNSCRAIVEEQGGAQAFDTSGMPDIPLDRLPNYDPETNYIESVEDVRVQDGERASATVTVHTGNGPDTAVQRFQKEEGNWTFCNW